jgi:hypothetical protein
MGMYRSPQTFGVSRRLTEMVCMKNMLSNFWSEARATRIDGQANEDAMTYATMLTDGAESAKRAR